MLKCIKYFKEKAKLLEYFCNSGIYVCKTNYLKKYNIDSSVEVTRI